MQSHFNELQVARLPKTMVCQVRPLWTRDNFNPGLITPLSCFVGGAIEKQVIIFWMEAPHLSTSVNNHPILTVAVLVHREVTVNSEHITLYP